MEGVTGEEAGCMTPSLRLLAVKAPHLLGLKTLPGLEKIKKVLSSAQATNEATRTFTFIKGHQLGLEFSF